MTRQIMCIDKYPTHSDRHRRVQAVGGVHAGSRWKDMEDVAIANVKRDASYYEVREGGRTVRVVVRQHEGRDYLKTETDHFLPDNLLSLSDCPVS